MMNLENYIELGFQSPTGWYQADATYTYETGVKIDSGDFDGTVTCYFEAILYNDNVDTNSALLVDSDGTTKATISIGQSTTDYARVRSNAFSLTSGEKTYCLKTPTKTGAGEFKVMSPRLIIKQIDASKTVIYRQLLGGTEYDFGYIRDNAGEPFTQSTSYIDNWQSGHGFFLDWQFDEGAFATIDKIYFRSVLYTSNSAATGSIQLYDETAAAQVCEQTTTVVANTEKETDITNSLTDGHLYSTSMKISNASYYVVAHLPTIVIKLKDLYKAQVAVTMNNSCGTFLSAGTYENKGSRLLYTAANFDNHVIYHRGFDTQDAGTGPTMKLFVAGSELITAALSSGDAVETRTITLTDSSEYNGGFQSTFRAAAPQGSVILFDITGRLNQQGVINFT